MSEDAPAKPRRLTRVLMWAAAAGILAWLFHRVPAGETLLALSRGQALPFAAWVIVFTLGTLLLDALTHHWIFRRMNPPADFLTVLRVRGETYVLAALGFLYGQGGMAYLYSRRAGKPLAEVTGSVIFLTFNSLLVLLLFPTVSLLLFLPRVATPGFRASPEWRTLMITLAVSWPLCAGVILFFATGLHHRLGPRLSGINLAFGKARPADYAGLIALRAAQAVLWFFFSWSTLQTFGVRLPVADLVILGPLVALATVIPTPGRLGTTQGAWVFLFQHQAGPAALLAFSLAWTVSVNLLRWLIGACFLLAARPGKTNSPLNHGGNNV